MLTLCMIQEVPCPTQECGTPSIRTVKFLIGSPISDVLSSNVPPETIGAGEGILPLSGTRFFVTPLAEGTVEHGVCWLFFHFIGAPGSVSGSSSTSVFAPLS